MPLPFVIIALAFVLIIVLLYLNTQNQWNWNIILTVPLSVLLLGGGSYFVYVKLIGPPTPQSQYWEITLGEQSADLKFKKGEPTEVDSQGLWVYRDRDRNHKIRFDSEGRVIGIYVHPNREYMFVKSILGVDTSFTPQSLIKKHGEPDRIESSRDELSRAFHYDRLQLLVVFEQQRVTAMGIYSPDVVQSHF